MAIVRRTGNEMSVIGRIVVSSSHIIMHQEERPPCQGVGTFLSYMAIAMVSVILLILVT